MSVAIVLAAIALAYHKALGGSFVFDDTSSVTENETIRSLWPLGPVLSPPNQAGVGGRPLANFTFALNFAVSGLRPWSYLATNLLLHGVSVGGGYLHGDSYAPEEHHSGTQFFPQYMCGSWRVRVRNWGLGFADVAKYRCTLTGEVRSNAKETTGGRARGFFFFAGVLE